MIALVVALAVAGSAGAAVVRLFDNITGPPNTTGVNSATANTTTWVAQSFAPSASGVANLLSFWSQCVGSACSGVMEIHADQAGQPGAQLGSGAPFSVGATTGGSPTCAVMGGAAPNLAAGTTYWAVMRGTVGLVTWNFQSNASRTVLQSVNSGVTWGPGSTNKTFGLRVDQGTTCGPDITANPVAGTRIGPLFAGGVAGASTIFLANAGNGDLVLSSAAFTGPDAASFQLLDQQPGPTARPLTFPRSIGTVPGQGLIMWVVCPPSTVQGTKTATLTVNSNDPDSPAIQWPVECLVDRTPPTIAFAQSPTGSNGWWASTPATLTITGVDPESNNRFQRLTCTDNGTRVIASTAAAATYSTSVQGVHTISCSAVDIAGNASTAFTTTIRIDTVKPVVPTTVVPAPNAAGWHNVPATVSFGTCTDAAPSSGFVSTIGGGGTFSAETAGTVVIPTGACSDTAGNTATPSVTLRIDRTPPIVNANVPPGNASGWHNTDFLVDWQCADAGAVQSGVATDTLADTAITFDVDASLLSSGQCIDVAGNSATSPGQTPVRHDLTPPQTTLSAPPASPSRATAASFTFGGVDGLSGVAGFECRLDAGAFAPCTSPTNLTGLAEGDHTFAVRAVDFADNRDPDPSIASWTVDLTAPQTTIVGPADPTTATSASVSFAGTDAVTPANALTFECSLDDAAFASCVSPFQVDGLAGGSHTLRVRATDQAGNTGATPATATWRVDLSAPTTSITAGPSGTVDIGTAGFAFTATDTGGSTVDGFECKLDAGAFGPCSSPVVFTGLAEGVHTFQVRAHDALANLENPPASRTWTIVFPPVPQPGAVGGPSPGPVGGPSPGPAVSDAPPILTLLGAKIQRPLRLKTKQLLVRATCNEACALVATATITIRGRRQVLRLPQATSIGAANTAVSVRLKLPKRAQSIIAAALKAGKPATVTISVVASDSAAQRTVSNRTVTLKR